MNVSSPVRWSIDELLVRYDLEPQLADIFVEGHFDKEILSEHFSHHGREGVFYEIDVVNVPAELLARYGLTSGNKQRVIALSNELATVDKKARVRCLVDRDLDHWFTNVDNTARLHWTRYCSLESHFITRDVAKAVVMTTGSAKIQDVEGFVDSLFGVLKILYALRLADRELALSLRWVGLKKYLTREGDALSFHRTPYVAATLGSSSALSKKLQFEKAVKRWEEKLTCDVRLASRGHDYSELLAISIAEFGGHKAFAQQSAVERLFVLLAKSVPTFADELI